MTKYYTIGYDNFIEIDVNNNVYHFKFGKGRFSVLNSLPEFFSLAEETNKRQFNYDFNKRLKKFVKQ